MDISYKIFTDGGARGNPGPAAGAFVVLQSGEVIAKGSKYLGTATNNEAEYQAVILALEWLSIKKNKAQEVQFFLDSELVVRQLNKSYKVKSQNLKPLYHKVKLLQKNLGYEIKFYAVKRDKNKLADKLVNIEIDENTE